MTGLDIKKAIASRIVFLGGDEPSPRLAALDELVAAAVTDEFDLARFVGGESPPGDWLGAAGTAPFMGDRRVVVVRRLYCSDQAAIFGKPELPDTALLILVGDEEDGSENHVRKCNDNAKAWAKALKDVALVETFKFDPKSAAALLRTAAQAEGKKLGLADATYLFEMCGNSLSRASEELKKVAIYAKGESISKADLDDVVFPSREWNVFKLLDGAISGDLRNALNQLRWLIGNNPKADNAIHAAILPNLAGQLRLVFQARAALDAGGTSDRIPADVQRCFPKRNNLLDANDYPRQIAFRRAKTLTMGQIKSALGLVAETDAKIKGQEAALNQVETMEQMILQLSAVLAGR